MLFLQKCFFLLQIKPDPINGLSTEKERKSFDPQGWVVYKIVGSCFQTSVDQMIEKDIEYKARKFAAEKKMDFISVDDMFEKFPVEMQEKN